MPRYASICQGLAPFRPPRCIGMDIPQARRIETPAWLNTRTALGLLLFSLSFLGVQRIVHEARSTVSMWAAARELPRDLELTDGDLVVAEVALPPEMRSRYASASRPLEGAVLSQTLAKGELVPTTWLAGSGGTSPGRSMTIPAAPEHALGGTLEAGDRIDVLATFDRDDVRARTTLLAADIEVIQAVTTGGLVSGDEAVVGVTVAVTPEQATDLTHAIRTAEIDLVRVDGPARSSPDTVRAEDLP